MISSASHQDKNLRFLENTIFVRRGELIMPLRVNAKRFKMTYSEMRTFILRLVRRKMITTRVAHLQPTSNHKNRKVTIINVIELRQISVCGQGTTTYRPHITNKD
ncbi:MAG: hypothetical protein CM15mV150_210 [Caudoviricetes sp.]|nr:MAG: hypothetical protein CM15mV150_210 [Caudoviricetes sp.]